MWRNSFNLLRHGASAAAARCRAAAPDTRSKWLRLRLNGDGYDGMKLIGAQRYCSSAEDGKGRGISAEEAKRLLRLVNVEALKNELDMENKEVIVYSELLKACETMGVAKSRDEAVAFSRVLDEAGVILLFRDKVYLHPDKIVVSPCALMADNPAPYMILCYTEITAMHTDLCIERNECHVLNLDHICIWYYAFLIHIQVVDLVRKAVPIALLPEDDPSTDELKTLQERKEEIDRLAHRQVRRILWAGLGAAIMQVGLFFRLTFWEFSWDVMEPIAFFTTTSGIVIGYAYFLFTSRDPTYQDILKRLFLSRRRKLIKKKNFDTERFVELQKKCKLPLHGSTSINRKIGVDLEPEEILHGH
nr:calcium uniporter protein 5, mitochondrial-like [Ipomoea batatas]GMC64890.1 calcium uniporter protein 5, mitochondrial-like [Ipomoea batatas]GMC67146.1 calcium uniporter protein 5, mitochondrial-like [Ipomoea batatas]